MPNPLIRERRDENGYSVPLDTLECTIERVTFHNPDNGYGVVKVLPLDVKDKVKADVITVLGNFTNPVVGESLRLHGTWIKHPQYGHQFKMERYETLRPATAAAIEKYLGSGMVKGIGPVMAKRIVAKFGEESLDVIEKTPQKLLKVSGLGEKRIDMITKAWDEQRAVREIMQFLIGHGVTPTYAVKIYRQYKERAIEVVEQNPYQLATDIWGIGFKSADKIAQNIGIAPDSPERLEAGLIYVLNDQMESGGHCFLPREGLIKKACEILLPQTAPEGDEPAARELAARAVAVETALDSLIERELLVQETTSFLGVHETAIYTPSIHVTEKAVAERVNQLLNSPWRNRPKPAEIDRLMESLSDYENLSGEQQDAVRRALSEPLLVLTGGPGVGKTRTTKSIVEAFEKMGKRLQLASPTGRAAKRAAEVTGKEAKTIHRLLAFDPEKRGFKHGPGEPLELDVLIVDESSMLDLMLTHSTLRAVPDGAQVVFVGDVDQLPSVGPGNVLSDLINSGRVPVARLTQVFRQAAASRIITNAHAINKGKVPELLPPSAAKEGADCVFLEVEESDEIPGKVSAVVAKSLPNLGYKPDDITVLVPMQRGSVGAKNLNEVLQGVLNPPAAHKEEHQRGPIVFRVGDRVMQRVNNYDKNVYNGDVGTILGIDKENQTIDIQYPEGPVEYDFVDADQFVHAFSLTIHKCIAEYERVFTADRGLVPIRDLKPGDCVHTGTGEVRRVRAVIPTGKKPVVRVTTKSGYRIDVSAEHPLWVLPRGGTEPVWRQAGEMTEKETALLFSGETDVSQPVALPPVSKNFNAVEGLALPNTLNQDCAYLLGVLLRHGVFTNLDGAVRLRVRGDDAVERVDAILRSFGLITTRKSLARGVTRIEFCSLAFRKWLLDIGFAFVWGGDWIPPVLFAANAACRIEFLCGLFGTDVRNGGARVSLPTPDSSQQVQQLLLSVGIPSLFLAQPSPNNPVPQVRIPAPSRRTVHTDRWIREPIKAMERLDEEAEMYDIEVEGIHSFVAGGGFVCHNSQGSEYPACIIALHTQHYTMLQRNLVYTALTRAKKFAVFIGSKRAIAMAVRNKNVVPRYTRLSQRLQQLVDGLGPNGKPKRTGEGRTLPTPAMPGRLF